MGRRRVYFDASISRYDEGREWRSLTSLEQEQPFNVFCPIFENRKPKQNSLWNNFGDEPIEKKRSFERMLI